MLNRRAEKYYCWSCEFFSRSPSFNDNKICTKTKREISRNTHSSCNSFSIASYFWCSKRGCQISSVACINILTKKYIEKNTLYLKLYRDCCKHNCSDGKELERLAPKHIMPKLNRKENKNE